MASDSPSWSGSRSALSRAAARVFVASGVLWVAELMHRVPNGGLHDAVDLIALAVGVVSAVAFSELLVRALWAVCQKLSSAHPAMWLSVASLALLPAVWRRDPWDPSNDVARLLIVAAALLLSARLAIELALRVDSARVRRRARRWASLALATALIASLASATEWWPQAAAFWLSGVALFAAILLGRLVVSPAARVPQGAGWVQIGLVTLCVLAAGRHWDSPRAQRLASGEGGLLVSVRAVAHGGGEPWRVQANENASERDAPWSGLREAGELSERAWRVRAGVARVAPRRGPSPLGEAQAQALSFVTRDALIEQQLPALGPADAVRASLWVRRRGGSAPALRVTLEGVGEPVSRVVRPTREWSEVVLEAQLGGASGGATLRHELDRATLDPSQGKAWWTPLPAAWQRFAADVNGAPDDARLLLFEDGVPLGPARSLHQAIREQGAGAYSHWQGGLYFSSSDDSDPRSNGRDYRAELHRRRGAAEPRASLSVRVEQGAVPADVWLWGPILEVQGAESARDEQAAGLRLSPTRSELADAARAATRHVIVVVLAEESASTSRSGTLGRIGDRGLRMTQAYASSDSPDAALASLATGLAPPVVLAARELGAPIPSWLDLLRTAGFHTYVQGMGELGSEVEALVEGVAVRGNPDPRAPALVDEFVAELREHASERVAALLHWQPARGGRASLDQRLAALQTGLLLSGLSDDTLLAVVAARGAEPGSTLAGARVLGRGEDVLHVPFVMQLPGLDHPIELRAPLNVSAVVATLLDVVAPGSSALQGSASLLAQIEAGAFAARAPQPVMAWTDGARVLRLGDAKYVADDRLGTHLLYDLASDPDERRPVYDAGRAALLAQRVEREEARLELLTRQLVSRHESELRQDLLAGLLVRELDAQALEPLFAEFWSLNAATRNFLMETIYGRRVAGLAAPLDALARRRFDRDDQVLLVLRAWAGSERAAQELPRRLPELEAPARRWLFEILPDLPAPLVRELGAPLGQALRVAWLARPSPQSEAGRLLAVGVANLAQAQGRRAGEEVKRWLVELHAQWSSASANPIATLRDTSFSEETLFAALAACLSVGDEALLDELRPSVSAARALPALVDTLGSRAAHERLLLLIDRWAHADAESLRLIGHMLPGLRTLSDAEFSRRAVGRVEHLRRELR
ncbi:MAG: hypothetical protein DHS20C15_16070 [Planctomycetota bacterium]|nr:MAG: hypothetical protein DHS20C15_16070 [Planctomycetota bacterium]